METKINVKNELDKPRKKNIFARMIEEIKSIFAKEPDENIASSTSFVNMPEEDKNMFSIFSKKIEANNNNVQKGNINQNMVDPNQNINGNENLNLNKNLNYIQKEGTSVNKNINIDLSQSANESEIVKKRAKHLVEDSLNERLELEDLSYYDLKILFNELKRSNNN